MADTRDAGPDHGGLAHVTNGVAQPSRSVRAPGRAESVLRARERLEREAADAIALLHLAQWMMQERQAHARRLLEAHRSRRVTGTGDLQRALVALDDADFACRVASEAGVWAAQLLDAIRGDDLSTIESQVRRTLRAQREALDETAPTAGG